MTAEYHSQVQMVSWKKSKLTGIFKSIINLPKTMKLLKPEVLIMLCKLV